MEKFPCTSCGQCCRQLAKVLNAFTSLAPGDTFYTEYQEFPYQPDENGVCPKLAPDNTCSVYQDRPALCNTDTLYERYAQGISKTEYNLRQMMVCNTLIRDAKLSPRFLVRIQLSDR